MKLNLITPALMFAVGQVALAANGLTPEQAADYSSSSVVGAIVDAKTRLPVAGAVVQVSWLIRADAENTKQGLKKTWHLFVKQSHSETSGRFDLPGWKQLDSVPGWKPSQGEDPTVRIYAKGYQRLVIEKNVFSKAGKRMPGNAPDGPERKFAGATLAQALRPLAGTETALAKELVIWKKDLETAIALSPQPRREVAIRTQEKLLFLFDELCNTLPEPKRTGVCYDTDSELGRYLAQAKADRSKYLMIEDAGGQIRKIPLQAIQPRPVIMQPFRPWVNSSPDSSEPQGYIGIPRPGVPPTPEEKR